MEVINTLIGEHYIKIFCESYVLVQMFHKNFQTDIEIENQSPDLIITINKGFGVSFVNYNVEITKHSYQIEYRRADYLIEVDLDYKTAIVSVFDELALKHALMNLYSSFIVHHNWGLLIHSSCAVENKKAHIFSGHSGAGKSTAAKLSHPRELLSDEATIVKITNEGATVFNSPFRSEIEASSFKRDIQLASIQLLYQASKNTRTRLNKSDSLIFLMDKVFFWPYCQEETKRVIRLLTTLVKTIPVYKLYFQKNNTFWELIS